MATLRQLETFITVAEYKKMSEAAKNLYVSQPTVSQIISDLEKEYGVTLFERQPKSLEITPAGLLLLSSAQEILSIHTQLEQSMRNIHSMRPLRVGATLTIGNTMMGTMIETLLQAHPDIDVSVFIDNTRMIEHRLIHNELDIALVEGIIIREEILTEPVLDDTLKIICGSKHPFAGRNSIAIEELRDQPFIMRERGSGTRSIFENLMLTHHIPLQIKWECSSGTAIIDAVRHNLGLGVLSERCIVEQVHAGTLYPLELDSVSMKRHFYLCHNQSYSVTSQMQDFINIIDTFQDSSTA